MFHAYTGDEQFDLQLNRFTHPELDPSVKGDLAEVIPQLRTAGDWYPCWSELARRREVAGDHAVASGYWGAAAFYEPLDSETKRTAVAGFRREFYAGWDGPELERLEVPYAGSSLPALRIRTAAEHSAEPLLLFGGFDSYMEEMAGWLRALGDCGRDVVIFDGPGQGTALMRGLAMPLAWERPVGAVLDALEIERCAAMGMSLGGLLVMRAAAFEPRVTRIVAMDVFYRMFDALEIRLPRPAGVALESLVWCRASGVLDAAVSRLAARDHDMAWKLQQALAITGTDSPHELLYELERWSFAGLGPLVRQDVLLFAGERDQYVPLRRLGQVARELVNANSVTTRVFTDAEHAAEHCQVGNLPLALGVVRDWLDETEERLP